MKDRLLSFAHRTFAIVDTETSGMSATHGNIIEIGIIRVEDGRIVDTYQTLLKPERGIPEFITSITGITNADLEHAPTFEEEAVRIQELLSGAVMVAHNARFDHSFLKNEFRRLSMPFSIKTLCTVKLSRMLFPEHREHNLDAVIARNGLKIESRHRAYDDAHALWQFFEKLDRTVPADVIQEAIEGALGNHALPGTLDPKEIEILPHAPGVYLFYSEDGTLLYIGKSIDLRTRVLSHFAGDHLTGKELQMCREVAKVEHIETKGELGALLLESKLIKERNPVYNRALRRVKKLAILRSVKNANGYEDLTLAYEDELDPSSLEGVLGIFKTLSQGKSFLKEAAREHSLCPQLTGIEKPSSMGPPRACFSSQLGRCKGACVVREAAESYNERFEEAFASRRIKAWPYKGPMVLSEETEEGEGVGYVIDRWCMVGTFTYSDEGMVEEPLAEAAFDYDTYKILARHIIKGRRNVRPYVPSSDSREEVFIS